jgi:NDP-sugar pyrophosphorylase family protein
MESALAGLNGYDDLEIATCIQHEPKGTADALNCAQKLIEKDFILTSCDNLYPEIHFQRLVDEWIEHHPSAILTLSNIKPGDLAKAAGVKLKGKEVVEIREKPGENSGPWDAISKFIFVLDRAVMDFIAQVKESKRGEKEAQSAIELMIEKHKPARKPIGIFVQRYLHLTSAEDLIKIHEHYLHEHKPFSVHPECRLEAGVEICEPVMIEKGAMIGEGAKIGPNVYIGHGVKVGKQASLERCIIYPGVHIHENECRKSEVIVAKKG